MMKATIALVVLIFFATPMFAQDETLFGTTLESGGYGAISTGIGSLHSKPAVYVGGYGGWLINHVIMIGGGGAGLVNDVRPSPESQQYYGSNGRQIYYAIGYGGLVLEYTGMSRRVVHPTFRLLIGGGEVNFRDGWFHDATWNTNQSDMFNIGHEAFFVLEPALNIEVNLLPWWRFAVGGTYRYVTGIDRLVGVRDTDLSGFTGTAVMKFGVF